MSGGLRKASETAARERLRLQSGAGRSRVGAAVRAVPLKLRHLGSEDAARSGLRYQPVAWTLIAVAAVAFFFPGRPESTATAPPMARAAAAPAISTPTTALAPATTTVLQPPAANLGSAPSPTATPTTSPPTTSPPRTAGAAPPPTSPPTTTTTRPIPLTVRGFGWAGSLSGSGLGGSDVPEGTIPVGARLGQVDKVGFIRLAGTETTLTLVEDGDGAREALGAAAVVLCRITDPTWAEEPDQSFDDAPTWDREGCVAGSEDDDTWTFDLSGFDDRDGDAGFALVPDPGGPPDFQVTFRAG